MVIDYDFWENSTGTVFVTIEHYASVLVYIMIQLTEIHDTKDAGIKQYKYDKLMEFMAEYVKLLKKEKRSRLEEDED